MLELDVLEHRPLKPLESSVIRTVPHQWPVLHVPFIHELSIGPDPISVQDNPDQIALQVNVQETHCSLTGSAVDTKIIPGLVSCARKEDARELFILNSAVMLDTVEKLTPVEICHSAQNIMLQESGESSDLQIRDDFFQITIKHDLTNRLHIKDATAFSDLVPKLNGEAASMEVTGTGAVSQSEKIERVVNLLNETNRVESTDLERSDFVEVLTETGSLAAANNGTSIDGSSDRFPHDECTLMSSSHQCTAYNARDEDSVKCLEVDHLSHLQSTSVQITFDPIDFPKVPTSFHETSICKELGFSCVKEVSSATCLLERMEANTADNINAPKENVPRDKDSDKSVESIEQEIDTTLSNEKQNNDIPVSYPSQIYSADTASTRLQDVQSDTSQVDLHDGTSPGNLKDDLSFKPNRPSRFENLTGAKALDTEDCSLFFRVSDCNTPLSDRAPDCHKYTRAIKLEDISDPSPNNVLCSTPVANICGETSIKKELLVDLLYDHSAISFIDFSHRNKDSEQDRENKKPLAMSVAPSNGFKNTDNDLSSYYPPMETEENQCSVPQTVTLHLSEGAEKVVTQSQGLCDMVASLINDPTTSLKIVEDAHCLLDTEDSNAVIHDVSNCEEAIPSRMQSNLIRTIKETTLTSDYLKVPYRTVGYCIEDTQSYALVPYVNIWDSLSKPDVNSPLSLKEPKNVISKEIEFQELNKDEYKGSLEGYPLEEPPDVSLKDNCRLKAFPNPQERVDLSHYGGKCKDEPFLDSSHKMKTSLAQDITRNVSADSFLCHTKCHSIKMHGSRTSSVPSTINQSEEVDFNTGVLSDSSVALDVHNVSVLPQLVDVRCARGTLHSEQTNVCFLNEKRTPHMSLSNQNLGVCSALLLPTCLPSSPIALTESKSREENPGDVLGNLQLHITNHADSSVQILDDLRQSLSLKQDTELGIRHSTTLKEPSRTSDSVQCMEILTAKINDPTQSVQPAILNDKGQFMLHMEIFSTPERNRSPVKAVVAIRSKATQVKSKRNTFNAEILEKTHKDCQLLKEKPRPSVDCRMEILSGTSGNARKYNLRSAPQSLKCSTSQETKRPKIYSKNDVCPAGSDLLNCVNTFSQKSKSHSLSQFRLACKKKDAPSGIKNTSCLNGISLKRQLNRRCKNVSAQKNLTKNTEIQSCKSSPVLKIHNNINDAYKSMPSKQVDLNLISKPHYSKISRGGSVPQKFTHVQNCTQDQMLLNKLSTIADRLIAPSKSETVSSNMKVVPFRGVKFQARKLLNLFTCVNRRINSQPGQMWQENMCLASSGNRLVSQPMNLYPASFPKTCFSSSGDDNFSLNTFNNLTFPVSFHVNADHSCLSDFLKLNPPDYILRSPQSTAQSSQLSEWTLSLFLSSHVPVDTNNVHFLTQWNPQFRSLGSSSESSHTTKSVRTSSCSMLGLHTVLALSSPGCYRLWTRRRNLGSRIPTVQKLSVMQFARGLKGTTPHFSRCKDQFSSLAFSLGRVLSTWSQHGSSAFSSDCSNTHANCSVWLPSQSNNSISVLSPDFLHCAPRMPLNTIPQLNTYSLSLENINLTLKPRISHKDDPRLPFCLSTQQKDDPRPPCWLSTQHKSDIELSSCSFKQEDGPKFSFIFSTLRENNLNVHLDPPTRQKNNLECPLSLSCLKHDLKHVVEINSQDQNHTICLDSQYDVSIQEDAVDLPCPESPPKSQSYPFEHRENIIIPCTQSQSKDQVNEKELFERKPQRVSQIRIRKTIPKPDPNLTPMGLPKPKRENKKEFSLEDIYTNKNYKSPPPARSLETIFEEPKEKNGVLISISQQKRKRILEFRDCTVPRVKRPKGKVKIMTSCKRGRKAAMEGVQLDALLIQKLMDLENCLLEEEALEKGLAASEMAS